jgi:predicted acylesterase/phospholipase RssA
LRLSITALYHLGVVKALLENNLLPKVVCGISVGSIVAALVCTHTDDELEEIFEEPASQIDLSAFQKVIFLIPFLFFPHEPNRRMPFMKLLI